MRILGIDYGERRVGFAVSDELEMISQGLETFVYSGTEKALFQKIKELIESHNVQACVIGLPLNMDGTQGEKAKQVTAFVEALRETLCLPVHFWDERLSTVSAGRDLSRWKVPPQKRKKLLDRISAQLILQSFLDFQKQKKDTS